MYICLCKGLTDARVKQLARSHARSGEVSVQSFVQSLGLEDPDVCGLCAQAPEQFLDLAIEEWERLKVRYEDARWPSQ